MGPNFNSKRDWKRDKEDERGREDPIEGDDGTEGEKRRGSRWVGGEIVGWKSG